MSDPGFDPNSAASHDGIFGLPHDEHTARVILIGVPFDATTSYRGGAAQGPYGIHEASLQVDLHDSDTGEPWKAGIFLEPVSDEIRLLNNVARPRAAPIKAAGGAPADDPGLAIVNDASDTVCEWLRARCEHWLDAGKLVGVLGGDHASPLGAILALADRNPGMGVLHIDAHADLRVAYEGFLQSHASIMHNVLAQAPGVAKLVQVAVRDLCEAEAAAIASAGGRIRTFLDGDLSRALFRGETWASVAGRIVEELPRDVYVSFDIDGLEPSLCPATGTPVPGGLTFQQACFLLEAVATSGRRIVGFDLCEVVPGEDGDTIDTITGARIVYKLIGWMLRSQQRST
ncbi:MAG: agmatinase family protein [Deltaproteobacteria bacterium]|nr:agmatinase family protein [Deltaproteobacteria bacterium]